MAVANKHKIIGSGNFTIFGLDEDLTPDTANDYLATYDASAGQNKKVLLDNLGLGGGGNAFTIFQPDAGTAPTADSDADTLTMTSSDSSITITGDSTTDELDFATRYSNPHASHANSERFGASVTTSGANSTAFGAGATVGLDCTAIGYNSSVTGRYGTATGRNNTVSGQWSSSLGSYNIITHASAVIIGGNASSKKANELLLGAGSCNFTSVVMGNGSTGVTPNAVTLSNTSGIGTNVAGADLTIRPSAGTGTGAGGELIFQTAPAGASGTTSNSYTTKLTLKEDSILGAVPFSPGQYATGSLPTASSFEGHIVYDTTTQTMKWSDGTTWATI